MLPDTHPRTPTEATTQCPQPAGTTPYPQLTAALIHLGEALEALAPPANHAHGRARIAMLAVDRAFDAEIGWPDRPADTKHEAGMGPIADEWEEGPVFPRAFLWDDLRRPLDTASAWPGPGSYSAIPREEWAAMTRDERFARLP